MMRLGLVLDCKLKVYRKCSVDECEEEKMEQKRNPFKRQRIAGKSSTVAAAAAAASSGEGHLDEDDDDDVDLAAAFDPVCQECGINLKLRRAKYFMDLQIYLLHSDTIVTAIAFDDIVADLTGGDAERFEKVKSSHPELSSCLVNFAEECVKNLRVRIEFRETASNTASTVAPVPTNKLDPSKKQYEKDRVVSRILILDETFQPILDRVTAIPTPSSS